MKGIGRRKWLKLGIGVTATGVLSGFKTPNDLSCSITARQELGPFPTMKYRGQPDKDIDLTIVNGQDVTASGKIIIVKGKVTDSDCKPVENVLVEIWQANHNGKYHHEFDVKGQDDPNFQGWGQAITNKDGEYSFKTILPGKYDDRTRHIHFKINRRGYHEMVTQLYFEGEKTNETDGLFNALTFEEQKSVTFKLDQSLSIPTIQFNVVIDKVIPGRLPEKVLAEYTGKYDLKFKGNPIEGLINTLLNGPYEKITVEVLNKGEQLYFDLPFAPLTEVFWKSRDRFDATSFYRTDIIFKRDTTGKVTKLVFEPQNGDKSILAMKI